MKRILLSLLLLAAGVCLLSGCAGQAVSGGAEAIPYDVEIREKLFIAQTNDIYANPDEYIGKTIRYEGMFFSQHYEPTDSDFHMVIRFGPGCCGDDGNVGFEIAWDDESIAKPADNDWVEVIGPLEWYEEEGGWYLRIQAQSLRTLDKRGQETVQQ